VRQQAARYSRALLEEVTDISGSKYVGTICANVHRESLFGTDCHFSFAKIFRISFTTRNLMRTRSSMQVRSLPVLYMCLWRQGG
jgi:hypothetical protein